MRSPTAPADELARLQTLRRYDILDSEAEQAFDDLTALAASICGTPISLISLVDADRQWFKSRVGLDLEETPRDISFCGHAILADDLFVVGDTAEDERFADNPLVRGEPEIRFYAGTPLVTADGHALGALCVMDRLPRELAETQLDALEALGRQTVALLEERRAQALLRQEVALVELLRESASAANESESLHEALAVCIERVCERIGWPVGHGFAVEQAEGGPRPASRGVWRLPADVAFEAFRRAMDDRGAAPREGPFGRVLATGGRQWVANIGAEPALARREAAAAGLFAAVLVPVLVRDEVVAVLEFYSGDRDEPDDRLLEVMGNLGTQLGRMVERERGERALAARVADLRAVLDATAEAICLSDADGGVRFVNTALEELWSELAVRAEGSVWSRLLDFARRTADPEAFANAVTALASTPADSARGEFELTDGRSFLAYSVPVGEAEAEPGGRIFVFRETTAERDVERLKEEFLASVSHELRSPLTSILGYSESLRTAGFGPLGEEQLEAVRVIERNATRLHRLIDDLLLTARIEAQGLDLRLEELDLATLAAESVQAATPAAESRGVKLVLADAPVGVEGDRLRLGQLLDNLVSNAVKFTPEGGTVTVTLARRDDRAVLAVADTGIGIPEQDSEQLFQRFYRTSTARNHSIEGTGLGLVIAKAIAESHGGSIDFESSLGEGTTFRVELPARAEPPAGVAA
jgi:signal transduction histidine kinase